MKNSRHTPRIAAFALAAIPLAATQVMAAQATATWIGAASADYANAANWDIAQVPLNTAAHSFIVSISSGKNVIYGVSSPKQID